MWPSHEVRNGDAGNDGEHDSGIRDYVRKNHVLGIDEHERKQCGNKNEIKRKGGTQAIVPGDANKQRGSEQFNRRITKRNMLLAVPALCPQQCIADDGNVVVKSDHSAARRAA